MKIKIWFIILAVSLMVASCGEQTEQKPTKGAFIGGTSGIVATFEPLSVLEEGIYTIFDSENFPLDVVLKNLGEETVLANDVTLRLLGPPKDSFENIPQWELKNRQEIEKISEFNPDGGREIVSFTPNRGAKYKSPVTGYTDLTWNLEYDYNYKTRLIVDDVCFKGDITDPKVCTVKERKQFSVSGAPITVTSVEEDTAGKGVVLLKINIRNSGTGKVTVKGQDFDRRFGQVAYLIDEPGKWECKSSGLENQARLQDGTAQVFCRLKAPLAENDLYVKNIQLTFEYIYRELIQEKLRVKESLR